jgi:ribonuclease P protein component
VDYSDPEPSVSAISGFWVGAVVPKRHAKRAVTRTLLKRQIRAAAVAAPPAMANGLWVVRLRAPFDRAAFPSAASEALLKAARDELATVFFAACRARHGS